MQRTLWGKKKLKISQFISTKIFLELFRVSTKYSKRAHTNAINTNRGLRVITVDK